jgi:ankyrin repeat protein
MNFLTNYLFVFMISIVCGNIGAMQNTLSTKFSTTLEIVRKVDELEKTAISPEYLIELRQLAHRYQQFCTPEKEHLTDFKEHPNLALLLAAELGNYEVIPDLIALGANVNTTTTTEMPLFKLKSEDNTRSLKLKFGNKKAYTPLMIAAVPLVFTPVYSYDSSDSWAMFLDSAEPREGHSKFIEQFIKAGAKADEQTDWGMTALHYAVAHFNVPTIKALIKNGASLNIQDRNGMTPLHLAVDLHAAREVDKRFYLTKEIVLILLEHGANKTIRTRSGKTARDMVAEHAPDHKFLNDLVSKL